MTAATEGVPGYVFGRIRAYREAHPESWRADQTAVYSPKFIAAYEQWEIRQPVEPVKRPVFYSRRCTCLGADPEQGWSAWDDPHCPIHAECEPHP